MDCCCNDGHHFCYKWYPAIKRKWNPCWLFMGKPNGSKIGCIQEIFKLKAVFTFRSQFSENRDNTCRSCISPSLSCCSMYANNATSETNASYLYSLCDVRACFTNSSCSFCCLASFSFSHFLLLESGLFTTLALPKSGPGK